MDSRSSLYPDSAAATNDKAQQPPPAIAETPCPYERDKPVALSVTKSFSDEIQVDLLDAVITKVYSMTMSPVVEIAYCTTSGAPKRAVLKIFDSRFGRSLRYACGPPGKFSGYVAHTASRARLWREYVRDGKAEALFEEIKRAGDDGEQEDEGQQQHVVFRCPPAAAQYYHHHREEARAEAWADHAARYEGALQYEALGHFASETRAYERLADLQGRGVPRLLAHVRLHRSSRAPPTPDSGSPEQAEEEEEEETGTARFFQVNGIIMEQIDGFSLDALASSPLPAAEWAGVLQRAVDVVTEINLRGVVLGDGRPGNVMVEARSGAPFVHDFAQSSVWGRREPGRGQELELGLDLAGRGDRTSFGAAVYLHDNPRHLILWLAMQLRQEEEEEKTKKKKGGRGAGVDLSSVVKYPDFYQLLGLGAGRQEAEGHRIPQQFPLQEAQMLASPVLVTQ